MAHWSRRSCHDDTCGEKPPRPLASSRMPSASSGVLREFFDGRHMARFGRDMPDQAMIQRRRVGRMQHRSRRGRHITIDKHRDAFHPRGEDRPGHGRDLAPAQPAQHFERIIEMALVQRHRGFNDRDLARQHLAFSAGARTDPVDRRSAIERVEDRRCNGCVADAHFTDAQKIGATGDRLHAERHRRSTGALVHRRFDRDGFGLHFQRKVEDRQAEVIGNADLVDRRRRRRRGIFHHLRRHRGRERRHAPCAVTP